MINSSTCNYSFIKLNSFFSLTRPYLVLHQLGCCKNYNSLLLTPKNGTNLSDRPIFWHINLFDACM